MRVSEPQEATGNGHAQGTQDASQRRQWFASYQRAIPRQIRNFRNRRLRTNRLTTIQEMQSDLFGHQLELVGLLDELDACRDREKGLRQELERKQVRTRGLAQSAQVGYLLGREQSIFF
jgi:hypothetical protein